MRVFCWYTRPTSLILRPCCVLMKALKHDRCRQLEKVGSVGLYSGQAWSFFWRQLTENMFLIWELDQSWTMESQIRTIGSWSDILRQFIRYWSKTIFAMMLFMKLFSIWIKIWYAMFHEAGSNYPRFCRESFWRENAIRSLTSGLGPCGRSEPGAFPSALP